MSDFPANFYCELIISKRFSIKYSLDKLKRSEGLHSERKHIILVGHDADAYMCSVNYI